MTREEKATLKKVLAQRDEEREARKQLEAGRAGLVDKREVLKAVEAAEVPLRALLVEARADATGAVNRLMEFQQTHSESIQLVEREVQKRYDLKLKLDAARETADSVLAENHRLKEEVTSLSAEVQRLSDEGAKSLRKRIHAKTEEVKRLSSELLRANNRLHAAKGLISRYVPKEDLQRIQDTLSMRKNQPPQPRSEVVEVAPSAPPVVETSPS